MVKKKEITYKMFINSKLIKCSIQNNVNQFMNTYTNILCEKVIRNGNIKYVVHLCLNMKFTTFGYVIWLTELHLNLCFWLEFFFLLNKIFFEAVRQFNTPSWNCLNFLRVKNKAMNVERFKWKKNKDFFFAS